MSRPKFKVGQTVYFRPLFDPTRIFSAKILRCSLRPYDNAWIYWVDSAEAGILTEDKLFKTIEEIKNDGM